MGQKVNPTGVRLCITTYAQHIHLTDKLCQHLIFHLIGTA